MTRPPGAAGGRVSRGDRTSLLVYLAVLREEAREHLTALHPATPPDDLTDRFLTWARARP
ncbi:hypothetical protein ACQP0I_11960 [Micromonospora carbonacea]|uniref:hypothetical protein n=1 Tax=Micromonospora carbonacea TaxID=47853 RepID=UPI003D99F1A0